MLMMLSKAYIYMMMLSNHLRFGLPLLLFHGTSITITLLPTHSSSIPNTCPYQFKLRSCTFLDISPTFAIPLIRSSLIQSTLVTPLIHLNTLISATYCDFFTAHVGEARAIWDAGHYGKSLYLQNSESSNCICVFHYSSVICRLRRASNIYIL